MNDLTALADRLTHFQHEVRLGACDEAAAYIRQQAASVDSAEALETPPVRVIDWLNMPYDDYFRLPGGT
jgi:hypothetical protein